MPTTSWAHLPTASHIDRVLASVKANNDYWPADTIVPGVAWYAAFNKVGRHGSAGVDLLYEFFNFVLEANNDRGWHSSVDSVLGILAYPDKVYMLDSSPGELEILSKFGDPAAILLLPACIAFAKEKELA